MNDELSIFAAARAAPEAIGLRTDERAWSFAELARLTEKRLLSPELQAPGPMPCVLDGASSLDTVVTLYALLEQRRPALLLHPR